MNIQTFDVRTYVMETPADRPQQSLVGNVCLSGIQQFIGRSPCLGTSGGDQILCIELAGCRQKAAHHGWIAEFGHHAGDGRTVAGQTGLLLPSPACSPLPAKTHPKPEIQPLVT